MKNIICGVWDAKNEIITTCLYSNMTREYALNLFYNQYIKKDFNTWNYCNDKLSGIRKSNAIRDRLLYDVTDDIIIYSQYA